MQNEISLRNHMSFILFSSGFLLLISSLYFEGSMTKPVMMIIGVAMIISAALHEYVSNKRNQTMIEIFSLVLILLWGLFHLMIW